ncbi:VanZ family protein [Bombilactobacillus folatiphilus]|uniref:VanZ family protein n=1 Tax=Bombilactobacillus folatiphilus TaxID=2923362 RepID=A0ABY4PA62_9LACO|nr:VanZ family protein [Bombilactobacillus folatiphilus]UQS82510.1 VanZ family protein [Bombilactobacillus folatiphilus]
MIFLNSIYQQVYNHWAGRINHFPLIRLIFVSLDKTIFYMLLFVVLRIIWRKFHPSKTTWRHEFNLFIFTIYLLLLFCLTVFRQGYFPWDFHLYLHRSLTQINLIPLVETWKLQHGKSIVDLLYNLGGNILWFVPFGYLRPKIIQKPYRGWQIILQGFLLSVLIESLQFILFTGVSDIDDVIFNTLGTTIGYLIYCKRPLR